MARDKFHVGQRVIWTSDGHEYLATVISQREPLPHFRTRLVTERVYRLDLDGHGALIEPGVWYAAPQRELRPIYDGDQPSTWSEIEKLCGWAPTCRV